MTVCDSCAECKSTDKEVKTLFQWATRSDGISTLFPSQKNAKKIDELYLCDGCLCKDCYKKLSDPYQICTKCVMDTSDKDITFEDGICNHCIESAEKILKQWNPDCITELAISLHKHGETHKYDCLLGLSGGIDSSTIAYLLYEHGVRVLTFHVDNGYNTQIANDNISKIIEATGWDHVYYSPDPRHFAELQKAFLRAGVLDIEVLTDHILKAHTYRICLHQDVKTIVIGRNILTESVLPKSWNTDKSNIESILCILSSQGVTTDNSIPIIDPEQEMYNKDIARIHIINVLNYYDYKPDKMKDILLKWCDWQPYGDKHCENIFTRYYQRVILPLRWDIDKRRAHYSSLINADLMARDRALKILETYVWDYPEFQSDQEFIQQYLGINRKEMFDFIFVTPKQKHEDFYY